VVVVRGAQIWDTSTGLLIATCHGHIGGVNTVCIDPCRMSYIVSGGRGKLIKVWSINGGSAMQSLVGHNDMIMCLAISPNAEWIVSGSVDRTAKVWDVDHLYTPQQKMVLRTTLYNHTSAVWCTAVSATGKYFVTGSSDETIKVRCATQTLSFRRAGCGAFGGS
jgi:WD40 repeat protein